MLFFFCRFDLFVVDDSCVAWCVEAFGFDFFSSFCCFLLSDDFWICSVAVVVGSGKGERGGASNILACLSRATSISDTALAFLLLSGSVGMTFFLHLVCFCLRVAIFCSFYFLLFSSLLLSGLFSFVTVVGVWISPCYSCWCLRRHVFFPGYVWLESTFIFGGDFYMMVVLYFISLVRVVVVWVFRVVEDNLICLHFWGRSLIQSPDLQHNLYIPPALYLTRFWSVQARWLDGQSSSSLPEFIKYFRGEVVSHFDSIFTFNPYSIVIFNCLAYLFIPFFHYHILLLLLLLHQLLSAYVWLVERSTRK